MNTHLVGIFATIGIHADFIHIGNVMEGSASPSLSDYDFQFVVLPTDMLTPLHTYVNLKFSDELEEAKRFNNSTSMAEMLLETPLRWAESGLTTFVGDLLVPQKNPMGPFLPKYDFRNPCYFTEELNREIYKMVSRARNAYMISLDSISASFGRKYVQDDYVWAMSHGGLATDYDFNIFEGSRDGANARLEPIGPLSSQETLKHHEFFVATCNELLSMLRSVKQIDSVKLVVIDLDDTLWRGVGAESEASREFMITGWPVGFLEALLFLKKRGIMLAIISKNDPENVNRTWERLFRWVVDISAFVSVKINWKHKSENMQEILREINVLPKSVVFIDDNPVERAAMMAAFPDIRVLGSNPYAIRRTLLWSPETQVTSISNESDRRTEMIRSQISRDETRSKMNREEFLETIKVQVEHHIVVNINDPSFPRCLELINKTNQFNTTGQRWTETELSDAFMSGAFLSAFSVEDRFTNYGIVCVAIVRRNIIEQLVMSCRVIGLGVELTAISSIVTLLKSCDHIKANAVDTEHNLLSRDVFDRSGFSKVNYLYVLNSDFPVHHPKHVTLSVSDGYLSRLAQISPKAEQVLVANTEKPTR